MLKNYSNSRTLGDDIKLGVLTAFTAGTINIASLIIFLNFTSNITGHYALLSNEISKGNWSQAVVITGWIFLFFFGGFLSNFIIINLSKKNRYFAHALPIVLEMMCLLFVGIYGEYYYQKTLSETEFLVSLMLLATGLQNGLTASISNYSFKTTHLTGTTTDLGILFSMFTKREYRKNPNLVSRAKLLSSITIAYIIGAVFSGLTYYHLEFRVFYVISFCLLIVIGYDFYKINVKHFQVQYRYRRIYNKPFVINLIFFKFYQKRKQNHKLAFKD